MTRLIGLLSLASVMALCACGVDGEPERPERATPTPGLSITGTASIGVTGTL